jgi:hypothetical protein
MLAVTSALVLLAMASGELAVTDSAAGEVRHGPLTASLTVWQSAEARTEVVLKVVLRNVSGQRHSFYIEPPGAEFFVKDGRRAVAHASVPCVQIGPCNAGLPELKTLDPGEQLEFVEHWRARGSSLVPGRYIVKAKLRTYQGRRPDGTGGAGDFVPFTLLTEILVRGGGETGG